MKNLLTKVCVSIVKIKLAMCDSAVDSVNISASALADAVVEWRSFVVIILQGHLVDAGRGSDEWIVGSMSNFTVVLISAEVDGLAILVL